MAYSPNVATNISGENQLIDVKDRLFAVNRLVFLRGEINADLVASITPQLLYLDSISDETITLFVNSPGGSIPDGQEIIDVIRGLNSKVDVIVAGEAASMAAVITACTTGVRKAYPNAELMLHQPLIGGAGISGSATDITINTNHLLSLKEKTIKLLAEACQQNEKMLAEKMERDCWLSPREAVELHLIDEII